MTKALRVGGPPRGRVQVQRQPGHDQRERLGGPGRVGDQVMGADAGGGELPARPHDGPVDEVALRGGHARRRPSGPRPDRRPPPRCCPPRSRPPARMGLGQPVRLVHAEQRGPVDPARHRADEQRLHRGREVERLRQRSRRSGTGTSTASSSATRCSPSHFGASARLRAVSLRQPPGLDIPGSAPARCCPCVPVGTRVKQLSAADARTVPLISACARTSGMMTALAAVDDGRVWHGHGRGAFQAGQSGTLIGARATRATGPAHGLDRPAATGRGHEHRRFTRHRAGSRITPRSGRASGSPS